MHSVVFDLRDAFRLFRRDRAYAATAILTLALAIGATTAVLSIVDGILLKPLPYDRADRLVSIREIWRQVAEQAAPHKVNEQHFEYWRTHARSFESLAQFNLRAANLSGAGDAVPITVVHASGSLFDVLRVPAAHGRTLTPGDDAENAASVVVITDRLWTQRFGADPGIVGTAVALDGRPYTVVGVLPEGLRLPQQDALTGDIDAFIALRISVGWIGDHNNEAIGRLRDGVTLEAARAEIDVLQAQVTAIVTQRRGEPVTLAGSVMPLTDHVVSGSRRGLLLLLAAVVAVLGMACLNLANLSLARTLARRREAAIRASLGASRWRLVRRALFEHLLLAAIGGAAGLWVAWLGIEVFVRTAAVTLPRVNEIALDGRVLAYASVVSVLAGVLVAMIPAWRLAAGHLQAALRSTSTAIASERVSGRSHATLLALQVALSVTLLVVTALFGTSFVRVINAERGFSAERVLAVDIALPATRYDSEPVRQSAYDRLLAAVRGIAGVTSVTTTSMLPLRGQGQVQFMAVQGSTRPLSELPTANFRFVAPEYFRTLSMPIRRGRGFTDSERAVDRPTPVVISEPVAARLWPDDDPLGKQFTRGNANEPGFEVVGVVADARTTALDRPQPLMVYVPYWWRSRASASMLIKTAVEPASILPAVRRALRDIDPEIAVGDSRPLERLVDESVAGRRQQMQLFAAFGLAALFVATVGVYAVTTFSVARRRREMNIRVALGGQTYQVVALLLRQSLTPAAAGMVVGVGGAIAAGNVVASLLFDVRARDPLIITAVVAIVAIVSLIACSLATRRALTLDPAAALREE